MSQLFKKLFIFDLANNHNGSLEHGLHIIREIKAVTRRPEYEGFNFGFKLQYRSLPSFIHKDYRGSEHKQIKRFEKTRLLDRELKLLKDEIVLSGFIPICTPFDEASVDLIEEHGFDIIKVASCSFTDWPLLERIAKSSKSIILSTAGATDEDIDRVVCFLTNRGKDFALMHCVAEYPTSPENLRLNRIEDLKKYGVPVGISLHENPKNSCTVKIPIAMGCDIFEKHVGIELKEYYSLNDYSATPEHIDLWLTNALSAYIRLEDKGASQLEKSSLLSLRRGVYAKNNLPLNEWINNEDIYFAIPLLEGQVSANDWGKYRRYGTSTHIKKDQPLMFNELIELDNRAQILDIVKKLVPIIKSANIALPDKCDLELSHHDGLHNFEKTGVAIFNIINREYCKKILILLPNQKHPSHYHIKKEETFHCLWGKMTVNYKAKDHYLGFTEDNIFIVEREEPHSFKGHPTTGCVFEEVSTTHYPDDSFYDHYDLSKDRKTKLTFYRKWLEGDIK